MWEQQVNGGQKETSQVEIGSKAKFRNDGIDIHQPGYCHLDLGHTAMAGSHEGLRNISQVSESRTVALNSQSSPKLYDSLDSCSKSLADANFECRVRADTMFKTHENRCVCLKFCADFVFGCTFFCEHKLPQKCAVRKRAR